MNRRTLLMTLAATPAIPALTYLSGTTAAALQTSATPETYSLDFDATAFTVQTKTVTTDAGDVEITYNYYEAIPYVSNPVDVTYQSLNISVPVQIDGVAVDASGAPILLQNNIGGYLSSSASGGMSGGAGGAPTGGAPAGGAPGAGGTAMAGGGPGGGAPGGGMMGGSQDASNADLALAAGYVVIEPGARGRDNVTADGVYFGKAPAAIVDLKAAVRYIQFNNGTIPGNTSWIVSSGTSAGGALSTLLGASGDIADYEPYLAEIGAADASDAIFAVAAYCPITDLDHADMAYEWMFGQVPAQGGALVDQTVSTELAALFTDYQAGLNLTAADDLGALTTDNYGAYLTSTFLEPSAARYLAALSDTDRASYLAENDWVTWTGGAATIDFGGFQQHVGRSKSAPAFDAFDLSAAENILFGNETTNARHFTLYSLRHASGDDTAELDADLPAIIDLMNPMHFLVAANSARAKNWFLRVGTVDSDTAPVIVGNLTAITENLGDTVDALMYWDAGHGANEDAPAFIAWIGEITGYTLLSS